MKNNKLIISELHQIDIYSLDGDALKELAVNVLDKINVSQLKRDVTKTCLNLTGVGAPSFGANAKQIALDNQRRLELTFLLLNNFDLLESYIKNLRSNKGRCRENDDYIFGFVSKTKDLIETIIEYGEFRLKEIAENEKQLLAANPDYYKLKGNQNLIEG